MDDRVELNLDSHTSEATL